MRILLVENNSTDQVAIQRLFQSQQLNYKLKIADSVSVALQYLEDNNYDLILLDYSLGDGTGLDLLRNTGDIPVIFIAGRSSEEVVVQAMKAGAYDYVIKDLDMNYLSLLPITIEKAMSRKEAEKKHKFLFSELERSNKELQNFATVASHDLQEPLRKIIRFGQHLMDNSEGMSEDAKCYADKMKSSAKRMQGMIEDLLCYSTVSIQREPFRLIDLNKVVRQVIEDLEDSIQKTNGSIKSKNLPTLEADPVQMHQLFQNLIGNSLKFHKKDQAPKIDLIAKPVKADLWDICVKDNGIGMDSEYKDKIFQPFFRLHGRSSFDGSGIGLAICEKIVTRHHGKIEACSDEMGSIFTVTLPARQVA